MRKNSLSGKRWFFAMGQRQRAMGRRRISWEHLPQWAWDAYCDGYAAAPCSELWQAVVQCPDCGERFDTLHPNLYLGSAVTCIYCNASLIAGKTVRVETCIESPDGRREFIDLPATEGALQRLIESL